jgi:hypothetical protein
MIVTATVPARIETDEQYDASMAGSGSSSAILAGQPRRRG